MWSFLGVATSKYLKTAESCIYSHRGLYIFANQESVIYAAFVRLEPGANELNAHAGIIYSKGSA